MDVLTEFTKLVSELEAASIPYATCGGLAMAVHGHVRATKDIDVMIRESDLDAAFAVARRLGYDIEGLPLNFRDQDMKIRRISKIEARLLMTVDFILVTDAMSDIWSERELRGWEDGEAWVVSRAGLIKMKKLAGRDQDMLDIKKLEGDTEDEN
jgi:hypothetical protein